MLPVSPAFERDVSAMQVKLGKIEADINNDKSQKRVNGVPSFACAIRRVLISCLCGGLQANEERLQKMERDIQRIEDQMGEAAGNAPNQCFGLF
jgi:hypothetical protein